MSIDLAEFIVRSFLNSPNLDLNIFQVGISNGAPWSECVRSLDAVRAS